MKKIAVLGSRQYPKIDAAPLKVSELYNEHGQFILVSGGADGPSKLAENTALEFGMPVISFRPVKIRGDLTTEDEYGVDEWRLYRGTGKIVRHDHPTWADWQSAAYYRSALIAERADFGLAFWDGHSPGTAHEIDLFAAEHKVLEIIKP